MPEVCFLTFSRRKLDRWSYFRPDIPPTQRPVPLFPNLLSYNHKWRRLYLGGVCVRRRDFIKVVAGSAAAWPLLAHAQQADRVRRIGMLFPFLPNESQSKARLVAFQHRLQELGWIEGRNLQIDTRWYAGNADDNRKNAAELVALAPDVIVASGSATVGPLLQATRTIPIVFTVVPDPLGAGYIESLARPGGNATG